MKTKRRLSPRLLTTADAAIYLGISAASLRKLRVVGGGPEFIKEGSRFIRYKIEGLDDWINSKSVYTSCADYKAGKKTKT